MSNKSLSITHFIPVYAPAWHYGGPVLSVSRLCEALAKSGHKVNVLTTNAGLPQLSGEELGKPTSRNGVEVTYFEVDRQKGTIDSRVLKKSLTNYLEGTDLLHLSSVWQPLGIAVQQEAYRLEIPVIQSLRGALGPYSRSQRWWKKIPYYYLKERPWLERATGLHVTTHQEEEELARLRLRAPCHQLPNPIDLNHLHINNEKGAKWRKENGIDLDAPLLLICGRLHHKKGLDLLPSVLKELAELNWQLLVVGNDDDGSGAHFKKELKKYNLHSRMLQLPSQPAQDLTSIYNAADLLLLPSRHENFGNVVVEALACGCAVAISDRTGIGGDLLNGAPSNFEPYCLVNHKLGWIG